MRTKRLLIVCLVAMLAMAIMVGCGATEFTVSVTGGTGGGTFAKGESVTVTATVPTGKEFVNWTVDDDIVSTSNPYTFTLENDVAITAIFRDVEAAGQFTVEVTDGTGGGDFGAGEECTLTADTIPGKSFVNWTVDGVEVSDESTYVFEVTANVTVVANFVNIEYTVEVEGGTLSGDTDGIFLYNQEATVTAAAASEDMVFSHWEVGGEFESNLSTYIFEVTENITIVAVYADEYTITVTNGTGGGKFAEGATVILTADTISGKRFVNWTVDGREVGTETTYEFIAAASITVVANFINEYTITVTGGTGSGTYAEGELAELTPDAAESNKIFSHWEVNGQKVSEDNPYEFEVTEAVEVEAVFVNAVTITVTSGTGGGKVAVGTTVTLTANSIPGKRFVNWTVEAQEVSTDSTYEFEAAASITVVANYIDTFAINVKNGETSDEEVVYDDGAECTVNPDSIGGYTFTYWAIDGVKVSELSEYTFTVTDNVSLVAVYTKALGTPDNSTNKLMFGENVSDASTSFHGAVAIDRFSGDSKDPAQSMFRTGVDYILIHVYDSPDGESAVGTFKLVCTSTTDPRNAGWIMSMDGSHKVLMEGSLSNFYTTYTSSFLELFKKELGYTYSPGATYYLAFQAIAKTEAIAGAIDCVYTDSEISVKGNGSFRKDVSVENGNQYTVTVIDGKIDGSLTEVTAGNGYELILTADVTEPEEGFIFVGWKEFDENMDEFIGEVVSVLYSFNYTVTKNIVLKPCFEDESAIVKTPLATPNNTSGQLFRKGGAYEFDRDRFNGNLSDGALENRKTMFTDGVDYVLYYVYANDSDVEPIATFKFYLVAEFESIEGTDKIIAMMSDLEGNNTAEVKGKIGDFYQDNAKHQSFIRGIAGVSTGSTYYIAAQLIAISGGTLENSEISVRSAVTF